MLLTKLQTIEHFVIVTLCLGLIHTAQSGVDCCVGYHHAVVIIALQTWNRIIYYAEISFLTYYHYQSA